MYKLSPSIFAVKKNNFQDTLKIINNSNIGHLHIDIMDGVFVPNYFLDFSLIETLRNKTELILDVHLMINNPIGILEELKELGVDIVTVHLEACKNPLDTIEAIKKLGMKAGIALNPTTHINELSDELLYKVNRILIMTVEPGRKNQRYIESSTEKIIDMKRIIIGLLLLTGLSGCHIYRTYERPELS